MLDLQQVQVKINIAVMKNTLIYFAIYNYRVRLQCGFEMQTSLEYYWSNRCWVANGLNFEWDLKFRIPTI